MVLNRMLNARRLNSMDASPVNFEGTTDKDQERDVARNTIQTMIVRLEESGWLKHREDGRTFWYSANRPRTTSLGAKVAQMVDRLFGRSPEVMVTALMEYRGLTADEAERIRAMIDATDSQAKKKSAPKKGDQK